MVFVKEESEKNTSEPETWRIKQEEPETWRIKHEEPETWRIKHEEPETWRITHEEQGGKSRARSTLTLSPAVENTRSDALTQEEEAWTQRYLFANLASIGIWSLFCHHHRIGSTELRTAGKLRYTCISFLAFSVTEGPLTSIFTLSRRAGPGLRL